MDPVSAQPRQGGSLLMSMPDIAELAGVQRPVVTNWRRRHADFPAPKSNDGSQPLFDARQVVEWLITTGRAERAQLEPDLHLYMLASLDSIRPARTLVAAVTALICLRHLDDEPLTESGQCDLEDLRHRAADVDPADDLLLSEITALPDDVGWLVRTVDDLIEAAWGCRGAFERVMGARGRLHASELYSSTVDAELARLMAGLSGGQERAQQGGSFTIADPAAGSGDLLAALASLVGEDCSLVVTAADPDPYLVRIIRRRLAVHGVPAFDQDVGVGSELVEGAGDPDVIVTQLAFRPHESRSATTALGEIEELGLRLAPGRTAVILGPADVLTGALRPYSVEERLRVNMLRGGLVEAIIRLPGGLIPFRPGYETALWVLNSAYSSKWQGRVLLADVSDRPLTADVVDPLIGDVVMWRRDGYRPKAHTRTFCVQANISDLVNAPGPLTARRTLGYRDTAVPAAIARVTELESTLDRLANPTTTPRPPIRVGIARAVTSRRDTTSVGALAKAGRLLLVKGTRLVTEHVTGDGQHAVVGTAEVTGHSRIGARSIDRGVLADRYPRVTLTEPDDVVVTTAPELGVRIDDKGYSVVEFPARALRITAPAREQFTPRVLAALLTAGAIGPRAPGAVRPPRRLDDWEIPVLDSTTVRRLDALLVAVDERRRIAEEEIDALDEIHRITITGLANATLALQL